MQKHSQNAYFLVSKIWKHGILVHRDKLRGAYAIPSVSTSRPGYSFVAGSCILVMTWPIVFRAGAL